MGAGKRKQTMGEFEGSAGGAWRADAGARAQKPQNPKTPHNKLRIKLTLLPEESFSAFKLILHSFQYHLSPKTPEKNF